ELWIGIKTEAINVRLRSKSTELRSKNSDLRSKSDQLLALVTQKAGDALNNSNVANERATSALVKSGEAEQQIDSVTERAEQLDRKIWQMKVWLSGRTIIDIKTFFDIFKFKKFEGEKIVLASYVGDAEAEPICNALLNAAFNAKMDPTNRCAKEPL